GMKTPAEVYSPTSNAEADGVLSVPTARITRLAGSNVMPRPEADAVVRVERARRSPLPSTADQASLPSTAAQSSLPATVDQAFLVASDLLDVRVVDRAPVVLIDGAGHGHQAVWLADLRGWRGDIDEERVVARAAVDGKVKPARRVDRNGE